MKKIIIILVIIAGLNWTPATAQIKLGGGNNTINSSVPKDYTIGGITVSGTRKLDQNALVLLSGLSVGATVRIPGEDIGNALKKLWKQKLFSDVKIDYTSIRGNTIFLNIVIEELPRLSRFKFKGVSKSNADDIRKDMKLYREKIITENLIKSTKNSIQEFFTDKGFFNAEIEITQQKDTVFLNHVYLTINVKKHKKVRINKIIINGNKEIHEAKILRKLKDTKEKTSFKPFNNFDTLLYKGTLQILKGEFKPLVRGLSDYAHDNLRIKLFKSSKYVEENLEKDKAAIIEMYNQKGYRDAQITKDSIYKVGRDINLVLDIHEGHKYYFRNILWKGNTKYPTKLLNNILGIKRGDIYNQATLQTKLFMNQAGRDVSSLYMDDGYLFFQITPVEILVENDSIDIEMRIHEGTQAHIRNVTVVGNVKTYDHVVMREIRTKPGMLFSRADLIRTQRELAQLGFFDAEKLNVVPKPNPADGTVDIEYTVVEKSADQIQLSGGFGGGRVVGTLGLTFSNFSTRNIFKKNAWRPLPSGDGQKLSIRAQSSGAFYQSYNFSFTEPWLRGRKPNSLTMSAAYQVSSNGQRKTITGSDGVRNPNPLYSAVKITSLSLGLGKRLTVPDDYFTLFQQVSYQYFTLQNSSQFIFSDGVANNLFYSLNLTRNSIDQPIYPRLGSKISLSLQATPPYSMFQNKDYNNISDQEKYKYIEYHKWKFTSSWFTSIVGNLVLKTKVGFGYLGHYNNQLGASPIERFYLGGSGLSGGGRTSFLFGREIIALRGYNGTSVNPSTGGTLINKYTMELRYPFSLNPSATIYGLAFAEAGNTWSSFSDYDPFSVKRSAGVGIRVFLPMFGLLGLDWGYRFDDTKEFRPQTQRSQIHFTIGASLGEL